MLITFEGGEGSGKSTQVKLLADALTGNGYDVVVSREPGGCQLGQELRKILLSPETKGLTPLAELFLYMADRAQHVQEVIRPALDRGAIVLCDRYIDSTTAYQGFGRGHDLQVISHLNTIASDGLVPGLTFLLDIGVREGLYRALKRNVEAGDVEGRFEAETMTFHEKVRRGYLFLAETKKRFVTINAGASVETVSSIVFMETIDRMVK